MLLGKALQMGLIKGAIVGSNGIKITHLQFANDTILFCEADWEKVVTIKRILRCFEILLGLKINYHKSVVSGIGINDDFLEDLATKLNCLHQILPLKYLGLPLGANPRRRRTCQPALDKCKQKLVSWERRFLSFAGRPALIKFVLSSLPVYYLSLFKMPKGVANEFEKIQSRFFWSGDELRRKIHFVKWGEIT